MTVDIKDLQIDYEKVNNAESRMDIVGDKVRACTASPSEITDWYFSQDPLYEAQSNLLLFHDSGHKNAGTELLRQRHLKYLAYERGAGILIGATVFPELFTEGSFKGWQKLDDLMTKGAPSWMIKDREARLSLDDIVNFSIERMRFKSFTLDELKALYIAADMITMASNIGDVRQGREDRHKTQKLLQVMAGEMYLKIYEKTMASSDFSTKTLGLKAKWMASGIIIPYATNIDLDKPNPFEEEKKNYLVEMIEAMEKVYLGQEDIDISKGELRGGLHELIWFLDFCMLSIHEDDNTIVALPSWFFQDSPKIDYPENNRGYDYQIKNLANDTFIFLQLKSKEPHFKKDYHPLVTVVHEKNFNDFQKNRLRSKLKRYKEFIETGSEESWKLASPYILGSVHEVWSKVHSLRDNLRDQTKSTYLETRVPKNKSARRRLMKDLKKRGIQIP